MFEVWIQNFLPRSFKLQDLVINKGIGRQADDQLPDVIGSPWVQKCENQLKMVTIARK